MKEKTEGKKKNGKLVEEKEYFSSWELVLIWMKVLFPLNQKDCIEKLNITH